MKRASIVALGAVLTIVQGAASADDAAVTEKLQHGEVNWTDKTVMATGSGAPDLKLPNVAAVRLNAERAAQIDAYRKILEAVKGVRISTKMTGADQMKDQVKAQVEGIVRGCKTVDTRYFSDFGVDVVVKCQLDGSLAAVLAPPKEFKEIPIKGDKTFTGLVIDATGLRVKPALAPRLVANDSAEIYSQEMVKPAFLRQRGAVAYYKTLDAAKKSDRVGENPLVIKAEGVGAGESDLTLTQDDVGKLKAANDWFLVEGRVAIATGG
jgi:hypothetical protein